MGQEIEVDIDQDDSPIQTDFQAPPPPHSIRGTRSRTLKNFLVHHEELRYPALSVGDRHCIRFSHAPCSNLSSNKSFTHNILLIILSAGVFLSSLRRCSASSSFLLVVMPNRLLCCNVSWLNNNAVIVECITGSQWVLGIYYGGSAILLVDCDAFTSRQRIYRSAEHS